MSSYAIKLDLRKMNGASLVNVKGTRCVLIPTDNNKEIFVGEKGIYLNLTAVEMKQASQFGDTHFLKGNLDKDAYNALTDEQRKALPIIGNMRPLEKKASAPAPAPAVEVEAEDDNDLPF